MSKVSRIVVFGGAALEIDRVTGDAYVKEPYYKYLRDLGSHGVPVVFFAMARWLDSGSIRFTHRLSEAGIEAIGLKRGIRHWLSYWPKLLRFTRSAAFISFLPNAVGLLPIVPILKCHVKVWAVYVGDDWLAHSKVSSFRGMPYGRQFFLKAHKNIIRAATIGIARGKQAQTNMQQYCREVELTLPLGHIDLSTVKDNHNVRFQGSKHFLFVGKLDWRKGLRELLKAFKEYLKRVHGSAKLSIIGTGPDVEEIRALAVQLGLVDDVKFVGWVDSSDGLSRYWDWADALIVPTSIHKEGVPRVIDEALARGLPVCATAIGGIPEEFTDGEVHLVEPANVSALLGGMLEITNNEALRVSLNAAGSRRIARWREFGSAGHQHFKILERGF